jgi:cytosine/adenosine deaminase-related metal-dependent hydrolase
MTVYEADWICPVAGPPIKDGAISVEAGRLVSVGSAVEVAGSHRMRYSGCTIIPGFVNAHAHLELTILRGLLENIPFLKWIQQLTHIKYQVLNRDDLKLSAQLGAIEMLRAGVTTVAEVMDVGTGWEAMREFGLQGIAYQEVFGPADSAAVESMKGLAENVGLLGPDMLLVHGVEVNERDLDHLRDTGTFVVHCPKSNAKLGNATARVHDMLVQGVPVSLGTDSVASNNHIDMFEEMRAAIFQQRTLTGRIDALTAADALRMATVEGARSLGMEGALGSLEQGKRADFVVVDLSRPATQPVFDPIETMVYSASRADVRAVFSAGRELSLDDSAVLKEVARVAGKLR